MPRSPSLIYHVPPSRFFHLPQDILARLEARRTALDREQRHISDLIFKLAQANVKGEKSVVEEIMSAAVRLFSKGDDEYPAVGSPSPWTMDKPKKK